MADDLRFTVSGVADAIRKAKKAREMLIEGIEAETEKAALRTANESASNAPRLTGRLANSITASPRRVRAMVWSVGSDLPYARRQEYEHKSRKGFFRKALLKERTKFREAIERVLKKAGD